MHHALISSAIKLLLYETCGEAALYGVQGERTRRAGTGWMIADIRFGTELIAAGVSEHRRTRKDRKGDTHCPSRMASYNPKRGNRLKR
jgi:hypothetical protein